MVYLDPMTGGVIIHEPTDQQQQPRILSTNTNVSVLASWDLHEGSCNHANFKKHSKLLIDYACVIHEKLLQDLKVTIVSNNEDFPFIILGFYLLRGMKFQEVRAYCNINILVYIFHLF